MNIGKKNLQTNPDRFACGRAHMIFGADNRMVTTNVCYPTEYDNIHKTVSPELQDLSNDKY